MGRVEGKKAIVTGGASGLGKAIASYLVREGAHVLMTDIQDDGANVAAEIGCYFAKQDVADEAAWNEIIAEAERKLGGINILVNNAGVAEGIGAAVSPEDSSLADWQRIHRINSESVFLGCKSVIPAMRRAGGGSIINMSSIAGLVGTPFLTAYGASKASVQQLTMSVALHCAQNGYRIRCNSVHPGQIRTPMLEALFAHAAETAGVGESAIEQEFLSRIPLGEFGEPDDIANAVLFLASDEAKHVTGTKLVVDGGMQAL